MTGNKEAFNREWNSRPSGLANVVKSNRIDESRCIDIRNSGGPALSALFKIYSLQMVRSAG